MEDSLAPGSIIESHVLRPFFRFDRPVWERTLRGGLILLILPGLLLLLAGSGGSLVLEGPRVGMLEDYLFLSFAFGTVPLLFLALGFVRRRFVAFMRALPTFTTLSPESHRLLVADAMAQVYRIERHVLSVVARSVIGFVALASNLSAILGREGGWNGTDHPLVLGITSAYLLLTIGVLLPDLLFRYLLILYCVVRTTRALAQDGDIIVRPLSPDRSGGLRSLGDLSLAFTYLLLPMTISIVMHYFTWRHISPGFLLGLVGFVPLFVIVFFVPLGVVHRVMSDAKHALLEQISILHQRMTVELVGSLMAETPIEEVRLKKDNLEVLNALYNRTNEMPVWPFNSRTLARFVTATLLPVLALASEALLSKVMALLLG